MILHYVNTRLNDVISRIESWKDSTEPKIRITDKILIKESKNMNRKQIMRLNV